MRITSEFIPGLAVGLVFSLAGAACLSFWFAFASSSTGDLNGRSNWH